MKVSQEDLRNRTRERYKMQQKKRVIRKKALAVMPKGHPLLLGPVDDMVQRFLMATRDKGGLVSRTIVIAAAKALIARHAQYNLSHIGLDSSVSAKSLFKKTGLRKRMFTTGKIEIPSYSLCTNLSRL